MNRKNTKRALLSSLLSLVLCLSMLVGSTFAWFTDNASTSVNTIQSGNLDVDLVDAEGNTVTGRALNFKKAAGAPATEAILWEPGATYELEDVYVANKGNLALKYKVLISGIKGDAELNKVITWTIKVGDTAVELTDGASQEFQMAAGAEKAKLTISGTMDTAAGNEYMNKTISGISIKVMATQQPSEFDSTTYMYDAGATYEDGQQGDTNVTVGDPAALAAVLQAAFDQSASTGEVTITLDKSFDGSEWKSIDPRGYQDKNIVIDGAGFAIENLKEPLVVGAFGAAGTVTIKNLTLKNANISVPSQNGMGVGAFACYVDSTGSLTLENCHLVDSTIECTDGYAGGLVGFASAPVTIKDCSVTGNTTITGGNSTGGIIGQFANPATVSGCTVKDVTISYANGSEVETDSWRVGVVVGTANVGTVTMTNITESGNTLRQGSVTAPEHSNLYGRSLGQGITLDGEAI